MVGEAPIVAFRLEKMANEETGRILVCPSTWAMACASFRFRDLGEMIAKGFDRPDHVFALEGPLVRDAQSTTVV
jgi:class 3 adenylate cyclase